MRDPFTAHEDILDLARQYNPYGNPAKYECEVARRIKAFLRETPEGKALWARRDHQRYLLRWLPWAAHWYWAGAEYSEAMPLKEIDAARAVAGQLREIAAQYPARLLGAEETAATIRAAARRVEMDARVNLKIGAKDTGARGNRRAHKDRALIRAVHQIFSALGLCNTSTNPMFQGTVAKLARHIHAASATVGGHKSRARLAFSERTIRRAIGELRRV